MLVDEVDGWMIYIYIYIYEYIYIKWGGEDDTWSSTNILLLLFIVVRGACYYCGLFDEVDDDNDQYWVIRIDVVDEGY